MADTQIKADPETVWVRLKWLVPVIVITAAAVVIYMRMDFRMSGIEATMGRDLAARSEERRELRESLDGLRDDMRKVFVDSVATRQAQAWIELARALNKAKFPDLVLPDLPR